MKPGYATLLAVVVAAAAHGQDVYVANQLANTVSVFELSDPANASTITIGNQPHEIAIHPSGRWVFVSNRLDDTVSVLDAATRTEVDVDGDPTNGVTRITVGVAPHGLAMSPDGQHLAVTNNGSGDLSIVSTSTFQVVSTVPGVGLTPHMCRYAPDGLKIWVVNFGGGDVRIVDAALAILNPVVAAGPLVAVGGAPEGVTITPDGSLAFVAGAFNATTVFAIDTATLSVTPIPVGTSPLRVEITRDGSSAWVANFASNTLSLIDVATLTVTATVSGVASPVGLGFSPEEDLVLAAGFGGTVFAVDRSTNAVVSTFTAGLGADGIVVQPPLLTELVSPATGATGEVLFRRPQDHGLPYQAACSFGTAPGIAIGARTLHLTPDPLLFLSISPNPFFLNFSGFLDGLGGAVLQIVLPPFPSVTGTAFFLAGITLATAAPQGIRTITPSLALVVQ